MKKIPHILLVLFTLMALILLTFIFLIGYFIVFGYSAEKNTLFTILSEVDWVYFLITFSMIFFYFFLFDLLICTLISNWKKIISQEKLKHKEGRIKRFWRRFRSIHLTFILLSLFLSVAVATPSSLMNTFTAIVSISVFVSTVINRLEKKESDSNL